MAWRASFVLVALVVACGVEGSTAVIETPCTGGTGAFATPLIDGAVTYTVCGDFTSVVADSYDEQIGFADVFWHDLGNVWEDTGLPVFPEPVVEDERYAVSFADIEGGRTYTVYGLEQGQRVALGVADEGGNPGFGHDHYVAADDSVESVERGECAGGIGVLASRLVGGALTYTACGDIRGARLHAVVRTEKVPDADPQSINCPCNYSFPVLFEHTPQIEGRPESEELTAADGYHVSVEYIEGGLIYSVEGLQAEQSVSFRAGVGSGLFMHPHTVAEEAPPLSGS